MAMTRRASPGEPAPAWWRLFPWAAAAVLFAGVGWTAFELAQLSVWRYDSGAVLRLMGARSDPLGACPRLFVVKYKFDGRWLNHVLSGPLCALPGWIAMLAGAVSLGAFLLAVLRGLGLAAGMAAALAGLALLSPQLWDQLLWPTATLPGLVLLALAVPLAGRLSAPVFFLLMGILHFGTLTTPYYLLPLLWLPAMHAPGPVGSLTTRLVHVLGWWVAGFVAGFAFSQLMTAMTFPEGGMEIGAWREPKPVQDWEDFIANSTSRWDYLLDFLVLKTGSVGIALITVLVAAWRFVEGRPRRWQTVVTAIAVLVLLSHFVATIYHGIIIQNHTLVVASIALVILAFGWTPRAAVGRVIWALAFVAFAGVQAGHLHRDVAYYTGTRETAAAWLRAAVPQPPAAYAGLVVIRGNPADLMTAAREAKAVAPATFHLVEAFGTSDSRCSGRCFDRVGHEWLSRLSRLLPGRSRSARRRAVPLARAPHLLPRRNGGGLGCGRHRP